MRRKELRIRYLESRIREAHLVGIIISSTAIEPGVYIVLVRICRERGRVCKEL